MTALRYLACFLLITSLPISGQNNSCPDTHPWTGHVATWSFGFAFDVPKPLKAYWNSAGCQPNKDGCTCMSDNGRIIPLGSPNGGRQIEMYGAHYDPDLSLTQHGAALTLVGDAQPETIR